MIPALWPLVKTVSSPAAIISSVAYSDTQRKSWSGRMCRSLQILLMMYTTMNTYNDTWRLEVTFYYSYYFYLFLNIFITEAKVLGRVRNLTGKHKDGTSIVISLEVNEQLVEGKRTFFGKIRQITEETEALVTIDINGYVLSLQSLRSSVFNPNK